MNKTRDKRRSDCPVACTLDLLGDRWTMLVVRDLFMGKTRFVEFQESREGIPTNILTDRLKRLFEKGVVVKHRYSERPPRSEYLLTEKGESLGQILKSLMLWGKQFYENTQIQAPRENAPITQLDPEFANR